jgi:murein DD-endopeptidase MepM/ murein hydrolase activator NlpD
LSVAAAVLALVLVSRGEPGGIEALLRETTREALLSAARGPMPEELLASVEELHVRRGQTVEGALLDSGVDRPRASAVLAGLGGLVDLRRVRPEDRITLFRARDGELRRLEYQKNLEERIIVEASADVFEARVERAPVQVYVRKLAGPVTGSLYESLTAVGGDPGLVVEFADLFSWDFDFFTDTRNGDRFELLVEERVVGGQLAGYGKILAGAYHPLEAAEPLRVYRYAWGSGADEVGYYQPGGRSIRKFFLKSPLNFRRISSYFSKSRFHPILKKSRPHLGIDYAAPSGTPVVALGSGRVVDAGWRGGYGRLVKIKHNSEYVTQYAHLSGYAKGIKSGAHVSQGQVIGYVGSSGLSTGPHLDFRVQQGGRWVNPLSLKGGEAEPIPARYRAGFDSELLRVDSVLRDMAPGEARLRDEGWAIQPVASARLDTPGSS